MVLYRHGLYVIGARLEQAKADPSTAPLGIFAIERFTEAEHMREHEFVVPADFDIRDHMHGAFGPHLPDATGPHDIVVEFSRERALYASSRTWHRTQRIEQLSNGRVQISLRMPALAPVVSWVLEWGPHARAIAPDALVKQVAKESAEAGAQYTSEARS